MKWGRPFDPAAEAIRVAGELTGLDGSVRNLLLLVDTGTPETIIDEVIATGLGLDRNKAIDTARFKGITGPQDVSYVIAPDFTPPPRIQLLERISTLWKTLPLPGMMAQSHHSSGHPGRRLRGCGGRGHGP